MSQMNNELINQFMFGKEQWKLTLEESEESLGAMCIYFVIFRGLMTQMNNELINQSLLKRS